MNKGSDFHKEVLTPDQYSDYLRYKELCSQLVSPPPGIILPFIKIEKVDGDKSTPVVDRMMNSYTRNWKNMFMSCMTHQRNTGTGTFGDGHINVKNTSGVIAGSGSNLIVPTSSWMPNGGFGVDNLGVVLGIGTQAESDESFELDNPIDHGVGAGEMLYYSSLGERYTWVGGGTRQWTLTFKRFFVNRESGLGSIVIAEVGLIGIVTGSNRCLLARDMISPSTVSIAYNKACRVTYVFTSHTFAS